MKSAPAPLPSGFDRIARAYRWLEYLTFGRALERCRWFYLGAINPGARRALVLGDGDGRFTARLLPTKPDLRVVAVDSSAAMLAVLTARVREVGAAERLQTVHSDVLLLFEDPPRPAVSLTGAGESFDLVATHFFLDCLSTAEVQHLAARLRPRLNQGGQWIVSEFAAPSPWARLVVSLLYRGFALLAGLKVQELPLWQEALRSASWVCVTQQLFLRGLLVSSVWQLAGATTSFAPEGNHATHLPVPPA